MLNHRRLSQLLWTCILLLSLGCASKPTLEFMTLEEADQKFLELCQRDFKNPVTVKRLPSTLWIYYPVKQDLLKVKLARAGTSINDKRKIVIDPLEVSFQENSLQLDYATTLGNRQFKTPGYGVNYADAYQSLQQNFMQLLQASYFNVEEQDEQLLPQFVVLVIADIQTGIEFETMYHFQDLKLTLGQAAYITGEEYMKRTLADSRGDDAIIGSEDGKHLDYRDITIEEFLTKQIKNRVNFKFTQSDFTPEDNIEQELIQIVARTFKIYGYTDYAQSVFRHLEKSSTTTVLQENMLTQLPVDEQSDGELHVINFLPQEDSSDHDLD